MFRLSVLHLAIALNWLFLNIGSSSAQVRHEIIVGRTIGQDVVLVANTDYLRFLADAGSSYSCEVLNTEGIANPFLNNPVRIVADNGTGAETSVSARVCGDDNPRSGVGPSRFCFIVPKTIHYPQVEITIGWTGSYPATVRVSCDETTLYANFNTSVTNFNFLELTNTLDSVTTETFLPRNLEATVSAVNTIPNPDVTVIDGVEVNVPAGSRTDVDIHTAAGPGVFGPVKIAHDGAPGSLKAVVSQYNITGTNPLTFAPVAQDVAVTRGQLAGLNR